MSGSTFESSDGGDSLLAFASESEMSNSCVAPLPEGDRALEVIQRSPAEDRMWSLRRSQQWLRLELYIAVVTLNVMLKRRTARAAGRASDMWRAFSPAFNTDSIRRSLVPFGWGVAVGALIVLFLPARSEPDAAFPSSSSARSGPSRNPREPASPAGVGPALVSVRLEQVAATAGRRQSDSRRQLTMSPTPAAAERAASPSVVIYRGSLAVNSVPKGAQVFVNNRLVGTTPLLLKNLPVGARVVRLEMDGYRRWSSAVSVVANQRLVTMAALQPATEP